MGVLYRKCVLRAGSMTLKQAWIRAIKDIAMSPRDISDDCEVI